MVLVLPFRDWIKIRKLVRRDIFEKLQLTKPDFAVKSELGAWAFPEIETHRHVDRHIKP